MKKLLKYLCPHTWFKKREIVFHKDFPYLEKLNIIGEAKEYKRKWRSLAKSNFDKQLLEKKIYDRNVTSSHRCLGMNALFEQGFLIKSPIDFAVESKTYEDELLIHSNCDFVNFSFFDKEMLGNYFCPKNCNKNLLKINFDMFIDAPKDIVFLMLPVNYDDNRFMGCSGILDPIQSRELNVILWWFCENSYELVRKGTPLIHLIPIPRKQMYKSWRMEDHLKDNFLKESRVREYISSSTICPFYSEYKKISNEIYS